MPDTHMRIPYATKNEPECQRRRADSFTFMTAYYPGGKDMRGMSGPYKRGNSNFRHGSETLLRPVRSGGLNCNRSTERPLIVRTVFSGSVV